MAAFGCNFEGDIALDRVMNLVQVFEDLSRAYDFQLQEVSLADTMGWANPEQIKSVVGAVQARWPEVHFSLHLHDTRGTGLATSTLACRWASTASMPVSGAGRLSICRPCRGVWKRVLRGHRVYMSGDGHRDRHRSGPTDRLRQNGRRDGRTPPAGQGHERWESRKYREAAALARNA